MNVGVLSIQGDFAAHSRALTRAGVTAKEIKCVADLSAVEGLIIPGGESTTILKFMEDEGLGDSIVEAAGKGMPIFGTCAGAILLAREVFNPSQASLKLIDITVERNGYGRQIDSFIAEVETSIDGETLEGIFIRAPRIRSIGPNTRILGSLAGEPVLVREANILAASFHPELGDDNRVHRLFTQMIRASKAA